MTPEDRARVENARAAFPRAIDALKAENNALRSAPAERWANEMAMAHQGVCPCPVPPRNGATMSCGCWWYADPGSAAGSARAICPFHGDVLMEKANVDEPEGRSLDNFTCPSPAPTDTTDEEGT